jgi:hypothetical protein
MKDKLLKEHSCWVWQFVKTVKFEEQDDSYQQISCARPYLQLKNSQLVMTRN